MASTKKHSSNKVISKTTKQEITYAMEVFKRVFHLEDSASFVELLLKYKNNKNDLDDSDLYFVEGLVNHLEPQGVSVDLMLQNKDLFMSFETKQNEGSFFTPLRWAEQAQDLVIRQIGGFEELEDYHVWDSSCGSGNLLISLPRAKHVWLSTLNAEDVPIVEHRFKESKNADNFTAFQLDFLSAVDTDFYYGFSSLLPEGLQQALENNEKLAIIINPPYSVRGTDTYLGGYLQKAGLTDFKTDLYRQFVWQFLNLVKTYNLTNVEFVLMVSASINISRRAQSTIELLDDTLNYRGGFIYPAREFEGVSDGFEWGISTTHWGISEGEAKKSTDVLTLMSKKSTSELIDYTDHYGEFVRRDKKIVETGETYFTKQVQKSVWNWLLNGAEDKRDAHFPKISSYGDALVNTNEVLSASSDALFYIYGRDTLRDVSKYLTFQTTPVYTGDLPVTMSNLDRAVWFMAYCLRTKLWSEKSYQRLIPPVVDDYFLNDYLPNAYIVAMMARVNLTYATRKLNTLNGELNLNNPTFPLTKEEVLENLNNEALYKDVEENYKEFPEMLEKLQWAYDNARPSFQKAWDVYKGIYKKYLYEREIVEGDALSSAYDLTFGQIRRLVNYHKDDEKAYSDAFETIWEEMRELNDGLTFNWKDAHAAD